MRDIQTTADTKLLNRKKVSLETDLRDHYRDMDRSEVLKVPEMQSYAAYYKRFKKTYHLLLQLESIVRKNKSIPQGPALVQAMFMAELSSLLLTAGHDLSHIDGQIQLDSANGDEVYKLLRGDSVTCKPGDMVTKDQQAVFCSIIYGQDQRTSITNDTQNVVYVVYVPPGIRTEVIEQHLIDLEENVHLISSQAETEFSHIYFAGTTNFPSR
jgi:DNA/RNA-binding domain of Phe-tRNA-synthetase-like protein